MDHILYKLDLAAFWDLDSLGNIHHILSPQGKFVCFPAHCHLRCKLSTCPCGTLLKTIHFSWAIAAGSSAGVFRIRETLFNQTRDPETLLAVCCFQQLVSELQGSSHLTLLHFRMLPGLHEAVAHRNHCSLVWGLGASAVDCICNAACNTN